MIESIPEADQTEDIVLETEYKYFFEKKWPEFEKDEIKNPLYKLQYHNNTSEVSGMFTKSREKCEWCGQKHSDNCSFDFDEEKTL